MAYIQDDPPESSTAFPDGASLDPLSGPSSSNNSQRSSKKGKWPEIVCVGLDGVPFRLNETVYYVVKDSDNAFGMTGTIAGPSIFFGANSVLVKFKNVRSLAVLFHS